MPKKTKSKKSKLKIGMMYAGELRLYLYSFFQDLGIETVYVPRSQLNFKELSTFSSDEWCYSLKLFYYDLLKALKMGANVLIGLSHGFFITLGPCRLPHVCEHRFKALLKKMTKKDFDYYVFYFNSTSYKLSTLNILRKMGYLKGPGDLLKFRKMLKKAKLKLKLYDEAITLMRKVRAREKKKGQTFKIYSKFLHDLEREQDEKKLKELYKSTKEKISAVEKHKKIKPKKIAIIGDYVTVVSEFPCFDLENFISDRFSIEMYQPHSIYKYYFEGAALNTEKTKELEKKYKRFWIGGSDFITFKILVKALEEKVDGIIQLRNFGCVPEQMILESIDRMKDEIKNFPPFLSICFDEHANAEGIKTRIEAFCNTLLRSKKQKLK
jgi:predicted nucleotide-binding protein (sugar kinase/HSP70/actin superfamily)